MGPARALPCPVPASIDTMPMKVQIPTDSQLWSSVGWDASSCDAGERGSEAGNSQPTEPTMPLSHHTPLRSQAAPFRPKNSKVAIRGESADVDEIDKLLEEVPAQESPTTVMMCNLPVDLTSDALIDVMDSMGFAKLFDFVYVPMNVVQFRNAGCGFVNLTSHAAAKLFIARFQGFTGWASKFPAEACQLKWSFCNGLEANIRRNQNSPIMAESVPAVCKPVLLKNGTKIPFPRPSKKLSTLRFHRSIYRMHEVADQAPRPWRQQAARPWPKNSMVAIRGESADVDEIDKLLKEVPAQESPTTVMMCNLPVDLTSDALIDVMDSMGFAKLFDFVYVPMNVVQLRNAGCGFVNLTSHAVAKLFIATFQSFTGWASEFPAEACKLKWSFCDGLEANIRRNQNSPIMAESVPAVCKPVLLKNGTKIPFPRPSKKLRTLKFHSSIYRSRREFFAKWRNEHSHRSEQIGFSGAEDVWST